MTRQRFAGAWLIVSALAGATLLARVPPGPLKADSPLASAVQQMDRDTIRHLLDRKIDVNASQPDGMTALHWAVYHDDLDLVDRLLRAGASARASNRYGVTPLSLACPNANRRLVERLLRARADGQALLPRGRSVRMTAPRTGQVRAVPGPLGHGDHVHARERPG